MFRNVSDAAVECRRLAAWAGMIGPTLFVAVFTLEGCFRSGYAPASMFVSELSLGPRGWIQIANFVVLGLLLLLFTRGVAAKLQDGKASKAGPLLLAIIGVSFLVSGPFVMDASTTPANQISWHGTLHQLFGALVFLLSPISCFVFLRRFRVDPTWRSLQWWTFAAGTIIAAAVVLQAVGPARPPLTPNVFNGWVGLVQRVALVTYLLWLFSFARVLHKAA
jgi:hypothetical protein